MRLVTFAAAGSAEPRLGALAGDEVVDLAAMGKGEAALVDMVSLFEAGEEGQRLAKQLLSAAYDAKSSGKPLPLSDGRPVMHPLAQVRLLAPVPRPRRIRDYLTYEQHASGVGAQVPEAFSRMPICYQGNVESVIGPDDEIVWPAYTNQLDFELEIGFFIGQGGRNISVVEAPRHIAGVTLFNDVSARDIQFFEMSTTIGPSKGKDFCNVLGPAVLTMDEVGEYAIGLTASINGDVCTRATTENRRYSFAEVLAWASYCEDVHPGEFLAVGTVGGGCGAELDRWVQPGDVVELEASGIGVLRNRIGHPEPVPDGAGLASYHGAPRMPRPN